MSLAVAATRTAPRQSWIPVCTIADLEVERGRVALVGRDQVALFLLRDGTVRAVSNYDPYGDAHVISRGIVGSRTLVDGTEVATVASPLHKQAWDLVTGTVVEAHGSDDRPLAVFAVGIDGDRVMLRWQAAA